MTTQTEALKLALEALESMKETLSEHDEPTTFNEDEAITALKEALAQPEQRSVSEHLEPVAWMRQDGQRVVHANDRSSYPDYKTRYSIPLYTAPYVATPRPQRKPLTEQMVKCMKENCDSMEMRGAFVNGWLSAEAAHGIKE